MTRYVLGWKIYRRLSKLTPYDSDLGDPARSCSPGFIKFCETLRRYLSESLVVFCSFSFLNALLGHAYKITKLGTTINLVLVFEV
jgi:hypothetical protein